MNERLQALLVLVWILGCWAGAVYCLVVGEFGLFFGLACASLALPIAMPVMREDGA